MYHELTEFSAWNEEVYVELQYSAIIAAVRESHLQQAQSEQWRERQKRGDAEFDYLKKYNPAKFASRSANANLSQKADDNKSESGDPKSETSAKSESSAKPSESLAEI